MDMITFFNRYVASFARARFGRTERGAALVEYALLIALIAVVCIIAVKALGSNASTTLSSAGSAI